MKTAERELAQRLRRDEGASIKEIARRVGVSQASVSVWVRDIDLTDDQHTVQRLKNRIYDGQRKRRGIAAANRRAERLAAQERGRVAAALGGRTFVGGCLLYWAEATKYSKRKRVGMLPYRTCRVVVSRTSVVQAIYGRSKRSRASSAPTGWTCPSRC